MLSKSIPTVIAKGQVEKWLLELERQMKITILERMHNALEMFTVQAFEEWASEWPGQLVSNKYFIFDSMSA